MRVHRSHPAAAALLSLLAVLLLTVCCCSDLVRPAAAAEPIMDLDPQSAKPGTRFVIPGTVTTLNTANFDAYVFANKTTATGVPQSWFVFIYAPYCTHCKAIMPQFINASLLLEHELKVPHARFGLLNAQANVKLNDRFGVTAFPTFVYTTGSGRQTWHRFEGGHSTDSFIEFAVYVQKAVESGSFADDVTDVKRFAAVEAETGGFRVPFYVYVPKDSASTAGSQRGSEWSIAVDGAASIGNARFGVIYERDLSPTWRADAAASSSFLEVVETAQRCKASGAASGPGGEVLVSHSDRFRAPQCFRGEWLTAANQTLKSGSTVYEQPRQLSPLLEKYITVNGFRAVEELNTGMFSVLTKQEVNYLGLVVSDGPLEQSDKGFLPALREMIQSTNEARAATNATTAEALAAPQVTWAYVDGALYEAWRERYRIDMEELPAFLIVDTVRNRVFRARTRIPEFEKIKRDAPWALQGPQRTMLEQLEKHVLADKYWGEKMSIIGSLAERLSRAAPPLAWLYRFIKYDDFGFVMVIFALSFFVFLAFIAVIAEPAMERSLERDRVRRQADQKEEAANKSEAAAAAKKKRDEAALAKAASRDEGQAEGEEAAAKAYSEEKKDGDDKKDEAPNAHEEAAKKQQ